MISIIRAFELLGGVLLLLALGCGKPGERMQPSWHQKYGWQAENYFTDPKVIALCRAIEANDLPEMRRLIAAGVDVKTLGKDNMTPLLWAFPDNKLDRFRLLLEHGADPNVFIKSKFGVEGGFRVGDSVTHMACKTIFPYFDDVFANGGDANLPNGVEQERGEGPLFTVITAGLGIQETKRRIDILLKRGANINQTVFRTPLMNAASFGGQYEIAMHLIENGADVKLYGPDERIKLTHLLVQAENGLLKIAAPEQKNAYQKLVKMVEDRGESLQQARDDYARWESWRGLSLDTKSHQWKQEVEARKQREAAAKTEPRKIP